MIVPKGYGNEYSLMIATRAPGAGRAGKYAVELLG
jgi:hypothetical protein